MSKVLLSLDARLLSRIDREARRLGLTRSAYLARLAERDLNALKGPGASPEAREALRGLRELGAKYGTPGDVTEFVRRMRDERSEKLGRLAGGKE